eukprot:scaffold1786_cov398-Prasinococcus_capsulatus_cf.AAC.8
MRLQVFRQSTCTLATLPRHKQGLMSLPDSGPPWQIRQHSSEGSPAASPAPCSPCRWRTCDMARNPTSGGGGTATSVRHERLVEALTYLYRLRDSALRARFVARARTALRPQWALNPTRASRAQRHTSARTPSCLGWESMPGLPD